MPRRTGAMLVLLIASVVTASLAITLDTPLVPAGLVGVTYGIYGWTLWAYPLARRFHFRRLDGRDFWLGPALLIIVAGTLGAVLALALPLETTAVLFLATGGALLSVGTLGGLLVEKDGLIDEDWG